VNRPYFAELYAASSRFIVSLRLPRQPLDLTTLLQVTRPHIERVRQASVAEFREVRSQWQPAELDAPDSRPVAAVGLNTAGMLCDRMTVIAMKHWVLAHRLDSPDEAEGLRRTQVDELLDSLAELRPGHSSFTQKISRLRFDSPASSWEEAYFGLLSTNVLLWEAQEILYGGRMDHLECDELRRYIGWFSEGNLIRNNYIASCETMFWGNLAGGALRPAS
jgi:hypothetical protein